MSKVSVIIPVYNVEAYLRQCLDSVVNQTLCDIEIICVDDGSTDRSAAILTEYAAGDPRVKVISREHSNAGAARNAGMAAATGEYLGFVDSDDWCELALFEKAYAKAKAEGADVVFWQYREWEEASGKVSREVSFGLPANIKYPFDGSVLGDKIFSTFNLAPWNRLVRRDVVLRYQLEFQQIERSNDVYFGCMMLAIASRISVVDEVLYDYRVRSKGSLQSENGKTPLSIVVAWKSLVKGLVRCNILGRYRKGVALASMYSFVRTLDVLAEHEYTMLFDALKILFGKDPFFATVQPAEISNDIMANALQMIRSSDSSPIFSMRRAADVYKWMAKFYREREMARKELSDMKNELPNIEKELSKAKRDLAVAKDELSGIKDEVEDIKQKRKEEMECRRLPGISLIVVSDGDRWSLEAFERHIEKASIVDREIVYVNDISLEMLDAVSKDYVAIVRDTDRYINDYALELLANTARCEGADVVGGMRSESSVRAADFVFDSTWLRTKRDLLPILRTDDQAFVAAAIASAEKHIVTNRVYTEYVCPVASPLVSVVVSAYNAERYLDRCLKSLLAQTHHNLEIIIVDDGSTDATASLCDGWAENDKRIHVIHKKNGGLNSARNAGMSVARGKYIGFVNSDDYVDVEMFGNLSAILECYPKCDVAKCGVAVEYTYQISSDELKSAQEYFQNPGEGEIRPGYDIVQGTDVCACDKLYRVEFLRKNGIMFLEGVKNGDEAFFFAVYCRIRNCYYVSQRYYHCLRDEKDKQPEVSSKGEMRDAALVFQFIAELLERENRRDLLGVLYRHMVGFAQRFLGTPIEDAVCRQIADILHGTRAFFYADLINGADRMRVQRQVYELMNRAEPCALSRMTAQGAQSTSASSQPIGVSKNPLVSFVVPVFNAEKYIAIALESLRRQTLPDFEVICIDDGSIDDSGMILDFYAKADPRIKVWHIENGGVSHARNLGLEKARGRYVAFFDGDDRLHPRMAARTVLMAVRDDLDAVMFDFRCFAYDSLKPLSHSWQLSKHASDFPEDRIFSPAELDRLSVYGSSCTFLWKLEFLRKTKEAFPDIRLGEDLVWVLSVLSKVRRMRVLNVPFYGYRRGNPSSAVSRLQTGEGEPPVQLLKELTRVVSCVQDQRLQTLLLGRIISDIIFHGEKSAKVRSWLRNEGLDAFGKIGRLMRIGSQRQASQMIALMANEVSDSKPDIEYFIDQAPRSIQKIMYAAMDARKRTKKDLIIVTGQLDSTTNEPIDSWTFFRWLQNHGVPCRYVVWRKHCMLERMRADNGLKDVLLLSGNGVDDYEFIEKCRDLLPRLRAVVMENTALNQLTWRYFHLLDDCYYIFLQHGVMFWKMASNIAKTCSVANYINVASEKEREFLEEYVPEHWDTGRKPQYLVAGLPRWDLLTDESGLEREKVIFYMPTWRAAFNSGMDAIAKSAYFSGVRQLVSDENLKRLKKRNLRLVMAAHHHLVNHVKDLNFDLPIELASSSEISYWIRHASLCITDYSSVCFDFLFLNKPCVFWTPDRYDGLLQGNAYAEVVFAEHQGANMFNRVSSVEDVMAMIEKYADSGFVLEPEKRQISDRYFTYRKDVCKHLYDQICAISEKEVDA